MQSLDNFFGQLDMHAREYLPVLYRAMEVADPADIRIVRYAESTRYRSVGYDCFGFYKPISRVFRPQLRNEEALVASKKMSPRVLSPGAQPSSDEAAIFLLFACCVLVMGARRSSICDTQRGVFQLIPNELARILKVHRGKSMASIKEAYGHKHDFEIDEYFSFLVGLDLGFWCAEDDTQAFPELDLHWGEPEQITNALIDVDTESEHDFVTILKDLDDLGCKALQVRFFAGGEISYLRHVLQAADGTCLRAIDLVVPFRHDTDDSDYKRLIAEFPRIGNIVVHSAPENRRVNLSDSVSCLIYRSCKVESSLCCGEVHPTYFVANVAALTEAQRHNSCLNRKISVDSRGDIKNCPSLPFSFGNVRDASLHSALARREFKELWLINKDQIDVCRDCEFRYMCTDCRAYLTRPDDKFSKPAKCAYDPYSAKWQ